jgi:lipopolysaccharide biosynthesis regulator YciM
LAKAETEFQNELKVDPESTESLYKLAVISLERSKTDVAAELFGTGAKTHASFGRCRISARASTGAMGNVDSAVTNFQAAVTDSGKSDTETLRQSYYQLAQLYRRQQKPEESRAALDSFMRLKQQADAQQSQNLQDKLRRSAQLQQSGPSQ